MSQTKILIVEDEELMRSILRRLLQAEGYSVVTADSAELALRLFAEDRFDVTITDVKMAGMDGIELLDQIKSLESDALVIIITAFSSVDSAVAALRRGAFDYVTKPFVNEDLMRTVKIALVQRELFTQNRALRRELNRHYGFAEMIGQSEALRSVFALVEKVAGTNANVLIRGESGTGKELVANAVHHRSLRSKKPFVKINCAALPKELIESELFGHTKGSFTGASGDKIGLIG
ncbi:MAG: sigma-54-dependent Fis family transcriptional regulator, partial [Blastocatellia bacterium]|nr:sigma-54-dependent Fis family transcriptional regulator [Blastocatellia bacterium]